MQQEIGNNNLTLHKIVIFWMFIVFLFSDRILLVFSTGGDGVIKIYPLITILIASIIFFIYNAKPINFVFNNKFILFYLPYLILSLILPFLGILFMNYPVRTLAGIISPITILSIIMLGYWLGVNSKKNILINKIIEKYLFIGILIQFLYSFFQFLNRKEYSGNLFSFLSQWDINLMSTAKVEILIGRSTGLFLNPNILGFWAVIAFWAAYFLLSSKRYRLFGMLLSLITLLLSQSRGALIALIFSAILLYIYKIFSTKKIKNPIFSIFKVLLLVLLIFILFKFGFFEERLIDRYTNLINIINSGVTADANLFGRIVAWSNAIELFKSYPFGTFGPPELIFKNYIDNDWFSMLLKGGFVYLICYLLVILGSISFNKSNVSRFLSIAAISISILALTQTPFSYSPIYIFWFFVGVNFANK